MLKLLLLRGNWREHGNKQEKRKEKMKKTIAYRANHNDWIKDKRRNTRFDDFLEIKPKVFFEDRTIMLSNYLKNLNGVLHEKRSFKVSTGITRADIERQAKFSFKGGLIMLSDFSYTDSCDCIYTGVKYLGKLCIIQHEEYLNEESPNQLEGIINFCSCIFPTTEDTKFLKYLPPEYKNEIW